MATGRGCDAEQQVCVKISRESEEFEEAKIENVKKERPKTRDEGCYCVKKGKGISKKSFKNVYV